MRRTNGVAILGITAALAARAESAKVLLFLSPFGSGNVCLMNNTFGFNGCSETATTGKMTQNPQNWMEYDFTTVANDNLQMSHGTSGNNWAWSSGNFNPYALFLTSDTVWAVTDPYPSSANGVAIKLLGSRPKSKTVMLWNPWETAGRTPWMRVESGAWGKMATETSLPGWYSSTVLGYNTLTLTFSDSAKTQYLGTRGISDSTRFSVDSIAAVSDTIWVRGAPETGPTTVRASARQPSAKTIFLFDPWSGKLPIQRPKITIGGAGPFAMHANPDYCGWYTYTYFDRTPTVLFTNDRTGATFGKTGIGSTVAFDASFASDSAWISEPAGVPVVGGSPSADRSLCEVSYLAATIRDFASSRPTTDPYYNREFGRGNGCGRGGWGVVRGMTDSILGADRKPVRSAHDTGMNYPNGWTFAFRCQYDTVEPATKAEYGDTGLAKNWFRTVPGKNVETCRDIPLALDSITGNYVYDNPHYFPIDDFSRLSDGTPNPFFEQISGDDGKMHDYGFCLESHGNFEYKKGQIFRFAGDDDVWFFINNRIAVDLGGIHGTAKDSVFLDSIGSYHDPILDSAGRPTYDRSGNQLFSVKWTAARLVENQTYPFDFFFCERDPQGSDMMIQTSMNLRTDSRFQVRDTLRSPGTHTFDVWVSTSQGQGCKAITSLAHTSGTVLLWGTALARRQLSTGTWYGGIAVDSAKGTARVDSSSLAGLPPGTYTLRIQATWDSTSHYDYLFSVPFSAGPRFTATPAQSLRLGDAFEVDVASYNKVGVDSASVVFHIHPPAGLLLFSDSLRTRPVSATDTLKTGINGKPRRLWAVGAAPGTWNLVLGSGVSDTIQTWTNIVVLSRSLAFVDSNGARLASLPPVTLRPGESFHMRVGLFSGDALCTTCSGTLSLAASDPLLVLSALPNGASIASSILAGGLVDVWVRGAAALDSASVLAVLQSDTSLHAAWSPVTVVGWKLRLVDSSGAPASSLKRIVLDPDESARVRVGLFLVDSLCTSCSGKISIRTTSGLVASAAQAGIQTDSITLAGGIAGAWIRGTQVPDSASVAFTLGSDPTVQALLPAVLVQPWRIRFVSGSSVADTLAPISREVGDTASVQIQVWGRNGPCAACTGFLHAATPSSAFAFQALPSGQSIDSFPVNSGSATFQLLGTAPTLLDSFRLTYPSASSATGRPVSFRAAPPDSGRMFDRDGDGRADSLVLHLHAPWSTGSSLQAAWPVANALATPTRFDVLSPVAVAALFEPPFGPDATSATAPVGRFSGDGSTWSNFPVRDGVPPVPVWARLSWGAATDPDTLRVGLSEPVGANAASPWLRLGRAAGISDAADGRSLPLSHDTLVLLWNRASIASCPRPGDSLGLLPEVADLFGNQPGPWGKKVAIQGTARPPRSATYLDSDGDGRIDAVRVALFTPAGSNLPGFDFTLVGAKGSDSRTAQAASPIAGDSLALRVALDSPFPFGWTSVPNGSSAKISGGASFPVLDGAGPAIDTALIRHTESYDGDDTLLVLPSEALSGTPSTTWWDALASKVLSALPAGPVGHLGDTLVVILPAAASDGIRPGDSLRWTAAVADTFGNAASLRWRPVGGSPRPAYMRLVPPTPLFRPSSSADGTRPALEIQVRSGSTWTTRDPSSRVSCDSISCSGPGIELNQPTDLRLHVYDRLGVHVASAHADFDPAGLPSDRLGRVRVRVLWNGRTESGLPAASGIYLMRILLRNESGTGAPPRIANIVWKIGLLP